jgi:anti-sigma factor RsiW
MRCPNGELISAFFDGEVDPPWSRRIEAHVAACRRCQARLVSLRRLQAALRGAEEPACQAALQRGRQRLLPSPAAGAAPRQSARRALWRTRVSLPLPAAAAVLALVLGLGALSVFLYVRPDIRTFSIRRGPAGMTEVRVAAPMKDLEALLKSLGTSSYSQEVVITLPADTDFALYGQPRMLRAAEYRRGLRP